MLISALAFAIVVFFALITVLVKPLDPISNAIKEFSFTDIYYNVLDATGSPDTCRVITIVDLTELHNRSDIARVLCDIEECGPKVVGCDFVFEIENLQSPAANDSVTDVAARFDNIVWASMLYDYSSVTDSIGFTRMQSSFFKRYVDICEGCVNMPRGSLHDSMKRKVPVFSLCNGERVPSFCAQVAERFAGTDVSDGDADLLDINFSPTFFRKIGPEDVARCKESLEGQIVLFGTLADSNDMHWTPIGRIPGVEVLAYGVMTMLEKKAVRSAGLPELVFVSFLIVLLVQILQSAFLNLTRQSRFLFVRFIIGSGYVLGILTFLFTSVFVLMGFLAFRFFNVSYSLGWALSAVAFLGTSRSMYDALRCYINNKSTRI